ncbi:glycosyltransferase family 2 protein [Ruicaihuangia caeni]|uniref:glycosyltransferase family 2 protein n=1 Tax=Ruicaihuangia caeni TaxID=3042517 RepID=UPI00338FA5A9
MPRPAAAPGTITVVIPCYNYGHYLPHAVESVLSQHDVDARVIIVDDASPDGSATVAQALADRHPERVRVLLHTRNLGHIATYNDGLALVDTEFVTLVSADDVIADGALGRATRLMQAHPQVGLVYGHAASFEDDGDRSHADEFSPPHRPLPETWSIWHGHEWIEWSVRRGRNFILSPEAVLRTDAMHQAGGYDPALPHSGDLHYWLRVAAHWDVGRVNGSPQAWYRVHGGNMHLTTFATMAVDLRHRLAAFNALTDPDLDLEDADELLERARRALAREALLIAARSLDAGDPAEAVAPLRQVAAEISAASAQSRRARLLGRRIARQSRGMPPATAQRALEHGRRQLDRVRWRIWETAGIS